MRKFKWGIIGLGKIANKFASDLTLLDNAELYAVASRDQTKSRIYGLKYGAKKCYGDYQSLINDTDVEVVYIATPHAMHKEFTLACLRTGKAVLCEKPLGLDINEVKEMIQTARTNSAFLMEALWTSCLPHYRYVAQLIADEYLGKVNCIKSDFGFRADYVPEKRLFNKKLGGGALLDIGIYPIFNAIALLGYPDSSTSSAQFAETGVDVQTHTILTYNDGAMALLSSSLLDNTPTETLVYCEEGIIRINGRWHEPTSVDVMSNSETIHKEFETAGFGYQYEAEEVMKCLEKDLLESAIMPLDKTIKVAELIEEVKKDIKLSY